jgi:hypothetical protein
MLTGNQTIFILVIRYPSFLRSFQAPSLFLCYAQLVSVAATPFFAPISIIIFSSRSSPVLLSLLVYVVPVLHVGYSFAS